MGDNNYQRQTPYYQSMLNQQNSQVDKTKNLEDTLISLSRFPWTIKRIMKPQSKAYNFKSGKFPSNLLTIGQ